ncbi:hypothetical protein K2Q02_01650 [Patescibacteria group bacterium]|nr:hypothetical protein [Patescibacteria group bacterium]
MTKKTKNTALWIVGIIVVIAVVVLLLANAAKKPGKYDGLAQCLTDSGAKFYGAFWCPHCQAQKALFGKSAKLLPYVECSQADGKGQLQVCIDEKIEGYPTWQFADGTRVSGEQTFAQLAEKTNCEIDVQ